MAKPKKVIEIVVPPFIEHKRKREDGTISTVRYEKGKLLGKGGFARCWLFRDANRGHYIAGKVVAKESLLRTKAREKFFTEIKIHSTLRHKHVVKFHSWFEDEKNYYLILELCHNHTLMEVMRRRKRLTEPEVKFFMLQLISAVRYLHRQQVIHRDLKLGNIFLTKDMNVKVGDFGLACQLKDVAERKKTICGTPNYIAPEILELDRCGGHSLEVDIWSIGVILYTTLIGRPPFETKDVKATYRRIRTNDYRFPEDKVISEHAKSLIRWILSPLPTSRPSLDEIVHHPFFSHPTSVILQRMPLAALKSEPTLEIQEAKLRADCRSDAVTVGKTDKENRTSNPRAQRVGIKVCKWVSSTEVKEPPTRPKPRANAPAGRREGFRTKAVAREAHAVIDAHSADPEPTAEAVKPVPRQCRWLEEPLGGTRERLLSVPLMRPVAASLKTTPTSLPARSSSAPRTGRAIGLTPTSLLRRQNGSTTTPHGQLLLSKPSPSCSGTPASRTATAPPRRSISPHVRSAGVVATASPPVVAKAPESTSDPLSTTHQLLCAHLEEACTDGHADLQHDPSASIGVWISKWVDYTTKYGVGYLLVDGSVGVYFNDATKIVLAPDGERFEYIDRVKNGSTGQKEDSPRAAHTLTDFPSALKKKVTLLRHFKEYLVEQQGKRPDPAMEQYRPSFAAKSGVLPIVQKWAQTRHAVLFGLSNSSVQVNFFDRSIVILSSSGRWITYIDKKQSNRVTCKLSTVLKSGRGDIAKRLKYIKDLLQQLISGVRK